MRSTAEGKDVEEAKEAKDAEEAEQAREAICQPKILNVALRLSARHPRPPGTKKGGKGEKRKKKTGVVVSFASAYSYSTTKVTTNELKAVVAWLFYERPDDTT